MHLCVCRHPPAPPKKKISQMHSIKLHLLLLITPTKFSQYAFSSVTPLTPTPTKFHRMHFVMLHLTPPPAKISYDVYRHVILPNAPPPPAKISQDVFHHITPPVKISQHTFCHHHTHYTRRHNNRTESRDTMLTIISYLSLSKTT